MSVWFIVGSALGAMLRFACERLSVKLVGEKFPYGTLSANVLGSLLLGVVWTSAATSAFELFLISFCGAFTTFGGFIGQIHSRLRHDSTKFSGYLYGALTIVLCIGAARLGLSL